MDVIPTRVRLDELVGLVTVVFALRFRAPGVHSVIDELVPGLMVRFAASAIVPFELKVTDELLPLLTVVAPLMFTAELPNNDIVEPADAENVTEPLRFSAPFALKLDELFAAVELKV